MDIETATVVQLLNRNKHLEGFDDLDLFRHMAPEAIVPAAKLIPHSMAQMRQDIFVAVSTQFKMSGYFVEIGATDGRYLSNSFLLENKFGWTGILVEPAKCWHETLYKTRRSVIETRCVFSHSNCNLVFREVETDKALSTILKYTDSDLHKSARNKGEDYSVQTVSLEELLLQNEAPKSIDYLSIDTEGSEFDILNSFNFDTYEFGIVSCEHNYTANRDKILKLMNRNRYHRVMNHISLFDDWYVHETRLNSFEAMFPEWRTISHQEYTGTSHPKTEADETISILQKTVQDLITDRDGIKTERDHFAAELERLAVLFKKYI
jgi:FkbM family methyltransferase